MKTIDDPQTTNDGCNIIYNGNIYEVYQDQDDEMYIIDLYDGDKIYLFI